MVRRVALVLFALAAASCADTALPQPGPRGDGPLSPGGDGPLSPGVDLAMVVVTPFDMPPQPIDITPFLGLFLWGSDAVTGNVCDNGSSHLDKPPMGGFNITPGPGKTQVNIGAGTGNCPSFIFDIGPSGGTLANVGQRCASGPGFLTTRAGTLQTSDGGRTLAMFLTLDVNQVGPDGRDHHCVLTVTGTVTRKQ